MRRFFAGVAIAALLGFAPAQAAMVFIPGVTAQSVLSTFTKGAEANGWKLTQSDSSSLAFSTPIDASMRGAATEAGIDPIAIMATAEDDRGVIVKLTAGTYSLARGVVMYGEGPAEDALQEILDTLRAAMAAKRKGAR